MDQLDEVYNLETVEQMRAIADPLRVGIVQALAHQAMTVTQLGDVLEAAPAKIHYHVRELERVGLLRLVETREKGGILEKYYRPVARNFAVPGALLSSAPDESTVILGDYLQRVSREFLQAVGSALREPPDRLHGIRLSESRLWMSDDEYKRLCEQIQSLLAPYEEPRGVEGERLRTMVQLGYLTPQAEGDLDLEAAVPDAAPALSSDAVAGVKPAAHPRRIRSVESMARPRRSRGAGVISFSRADLERVVARGETYDINMVGVCVIADDVTPALADRAISRFTFHGLLTAPDEVSAVLKRKEA